MASVALTFGGAVKNYPLLSENPSKRVQAKIKEILDFTAMEVVMRLSIPGRDYNDRTGKLRSSWRRRKVNRSRYRYRVSNPTEYASFIEYGTYKIEARKMLRREMRNGRARLRRRLKALENLVRRGLL